MSAVSRAFPGLPTDRAKRIAYFESRIAARRAADPLTQYADLFRLADPEAVKQVRLTRILEGRVVGLSTHHEYLRRCFTLRAWCAAKLGWRNEIKVALFESAVHKRLARAARAEGR